MAKETDMHRRLAVLSATLWAFVASGMIGSTQKVDLTDKPTPTAALPYSITDGDGNLVIDIAVFPTQRQVDSTPGQLFSAGGLPGVLLTGSTLTASFVGVNAGDAGTLRNKVVGFQIVEVPEPGTVGLLGVAAAGLLVRRRRTA